MSTPTSTTSAPSSRGLTESTLPELQAAYGINYSFEGRSADQRETLGDMRKGLVLGLILIYVILTWVFSSYGWPLVVMAAIPFGLTGALFGHWLIGIDVTILSLFGMFGLSGIVINDSIILVRFYQELLDQGIASRDALIEAACQRLRAVLLTSLTTIAGLTPLLFEKSVQAQFLIPMATSIAFGLGFATLLILFPCSRSRQRRLGRLFRPSALDQGLRQSKLREQNASSRTAPRPR
jgi:multidrug efflux pump subunit AcrB